MCLIFIAVRQHPRYKLVVAANRDEFYNRPTSAAAFWSDHPQILGGRDQVAHGTWLGVTRNGRIAMVTNYRDLDRQRPEAPSRGHLVTDFLRGDRGGQAHLQELAKGAEVYNGFSLIAGTVDDLWYLSNYADALVHLTDGLYGLSNHLLETPWPKVEKGKRRLEVLLKSPVLHVDDLYKVLSDESISRDEDLPDTGVGLTMERALSAAFIRSENYGTRASTVILVDDRNRVSFNERSFIPEKNDFEYRSYEYTIGNAGTL